MARDLKHRIPSIRDQSPQRKRGNGLARPLVGLVVLFVIAGGFFSLNGPKTPPGPGPEPQAKAPAPQPLEPRFRFFKLLEDQEIRISESEVHAEQRAERMGRPPREGEFFVQAGAFRDRNTAQALKETLVDLGKLKPHLEEIRLEYATWYRVRLGPYRNLRQANQVRLFLKERSIDSILQGQK